MIVDLGIRRFKQSLVYNNNDEIKEYKKKQWKTIDLKDTKSGTNRRMNRMTTSSDPKYTKKSTPQRKKVYGRKVNEEHLKLKAKKKD